MKRIVSIVILLSLFYSCKHEKALQVEESKSCEAQIVQLDHLIDLLYSKNLDDVQFIDIRTPHEYAVSHIPGAINIPLKNFFSEEYWKKVDPKKVLLVYGRDASDAQIASIFARHFKNARLYAVLGGYDFVQNKILKNIGFYSGVYNDEIPLVDFQEKINEIKSMSGGVSAPKKVKKVQVIQPVKRKKKEVSGGCG